MEMPPSICTVAVSGRTGGAGLAGTSRWSIVSLVVFVVVGGLLLSRVDEGQGIRVAGQENAALAS